VAPNLRARIVGQYFNLHGRVDRPVPIAVGKNRETGDSPLHCTPSLRQKNQWETGNRGKPGTARVFPSNSNFHTLKRGDAACNGPDSHHWTGMLTAGPVSQALDN
jgi:hypothetical protein